MFFEALGNLINRSLFVSLDSIGGKPLVKGFYSLGIAAVAVWAINHFFYAFSLGFGAGLWGIVEVLVFGLLAIAALRLISEALIVYFEAHQKETRTATTAEIPSSLVDEVREAIEELGTETPEEPETEKKATPAKQPAKQPAKKPASKAAATKKASSTTGKATPRTARRTPRKTATKDTAADDNKS